MAAPAQVALLALLAGSCAAPVARPTGPGPIAQAEGRWREQIHWVPMADADGTPRLLYTRICRPEGDAPARVAVLNHGTGPTRYILAPLACTDEAPQWFLNHGFMVAMPIRRGYGATSGNDSASLAATGHGFHSCNDLEPGRMATEAARDVAATVEYATALPGARPDHAVVLGVSTGGYTTIAYNSTPHPKVVATINVSGGIGGRIGQAIGQVCHPERLVRDAGTLGATTQGPMLWLYARNDFFFSPDLGRAMWQAYTAAGGRAEFVETRVFGTDGHELFNGRGGSGVWGPPIETYLSERGS